jgi:large repetitive protein
LSEQLSRFTRRRPGEAEYFWSNGSRQNAIDIRDTGRYSVIKKNSCQLLSDTIRLGIEDCSCPVYIPDIFSPDDNRVNDTWKPIATCRMPEYDLSVYNRFGQLIFYTQNEDISWDGTFKGILVQEGTYVYLLKAKNQYGGSVYESGHVTVIR